MKSMEKTKGEGIMRRPFISLCMALVLVASLFLAACSGSNGNSTGGTPTGTTGSQTSGTTDNTSSDKASSSAKEPITFTFFNSDLGEDSPFNDPVAKKITELTGVTLKIDYAVGMSASERIPLMIAANEYPDLIYAKGDTGKLYDAGALVQLDEMIEQKGTNIKKLYGDYLPRIRISAEDPHYYCLGAFGVGAEVWKVGSNVPIQHAVLKEFGYPEIRTLAQVEDILAKYIEKYPEIDSRKTIGMSLNCDDWHWYIDLSDPSGQITGHIPDGQWIINQNSFDSQYKFLNNDLKEYFRWLTHMYEIGLLDPETFTQKEDDFKAKIANGQVLSHMAAEWEYGESIQSLRNEGKEERTYAQLPITISENVKPVNSYDGGWSGSWGVAITTACKDINRAFDFLEWYCSDEAQVLVNWGIEGEHYTYENGKRVVIPAFQEMKNTDPDFKRKTGVGSYNYPWPQYGDGRTDSNGDTYTPESPESIIANYNKAEKETLAAYGATMWRDLFPPTSDFPMTPYGAAWQVSIPTESDINIIMKQCDDFSQMTLPQIVIGGTANFDANWDAYIVGLKGLDVEKMNAQFSELVRAQVAFWAK